MRDVVFLLIVIGFFAVAVAYVRACAAVVGEASVSEVAAGADEPTGASEAAA
jgi:hypothetical protein